MGGNYNLRANDTVVMVYEPVGQPAAAGDYPATVHMNGQTPGSADQTHVGTLFIEESVSTQTQGQSGSTDQTDTSDDDQTDSDDGDTTQTGGSNGNSRTPTGPSETVSATVLFDGDGLPDTYERRVLETDPLTPDSDAGVTDADESGNGIVDGREDFDDPGYT